MIYTYLNKKLETYGNWVSNKKIAILKTDACDSALLEFLNKNNASVTIFDKKPIDKLNVEILSLIKKYGNNYALGDNCLSKLNGFDMVIGTKNYLQDFPEAIEDNSIVPDIDIFMGLCPCTVIGVTGSIGKTVTANMICDVLKEKGYKCYTNTYEEHDWISKLNIMDSKSIMVLELNIDDLVNMCSSPNIAVITDVSPLNCNLSNTYKSYEKYINSYKNIFLHQSSEDILVIDADNEVTDKMKLEAKGKVVPFSCKYKLDCGIMYENNTIKLCEDGLRRHIINTKNIAISGSQNYKNICASIAATSSLVDIDTQINAIYKFYGV